MNTKIKDKKISVLAIASLVLSVLSIFIGPLGSLPGIICGHMAISKSKRNPNIGGQGLAVAGLIIGYIFIVLYSLAILIFLNISISN